MKAKRTISGIKSKANKLKIYPRIDNPKKAGNMFLKAYVLEVNLPSEILLVKKGK